MSLLSGSVSEGYEGWHKGEKCVILQNVRLQIMCRYEKSMLTKDSLLSKICAIPKSCVQGENCVLAIKHVHAFF